MALFNFKKEKKPCCCSCGATTHKAPEKKCCGKSIKEVCSVKVLGAGCKSCHEQYENAKAAAKNLGLEIEVEYVTDMQKVMEYGVMSMPAIVVNEKVVSMGRVLKTTEVEKLLLV